MLYTQYKNLTVLNCIHFIAKSECGKTPVIANGEVAEETGQIKCNNGYQQEVDNLTCQDGKWTSGGIPLNAVCRCESSTFLFSDISIYTRVIGFNFNTVHVFIFCSYWHSLQSPT